ncbi:ComEC/Rec2 family competence protein [Auritidibacter ignavus]|uniref:ComEC/Rec2 family competence protein n=1 Tax=Auritidibacter ignavus TaxID=678932 RepID=UPI000F020B1B|nr:ComEC/Rec2 family competence protein [Auritidibacter ignavus]NIH70557.1 competence protein ComEC [Auritidibacter ignavus]RMX23261.1 ComEC/Rec2 family competence protein [Auritidibacter ignavus]
MVSSASETPDLRHSIEPPRVLPVDIRLLPAVGVSLVGCLWIPSLSVEKARAIPLLCLGLGLICTGLFFRSRRRTGTHRRAGMVARLTAVLALGFWLALAPVTSAFHQRLQAEESGWAEAVAAQEQIRVHVEVEETPTSSAGQFGTRWFVQASVERFGTELTEIDHPAELMISSNDERWATVAVGDHLCLFGTPQPAEGSGTVFFSADTGPQPGDCQRPASHESTGTTGREIIRSGLREHSRDTFGTAEQLLPGLILGDRSAESDELNEAMKTAGLSHLSAVSGANCSLIAGAVTLALRSLRAPPAVVLTGVLGTLVIFVDIVGWEPSVVRAGVMGAISAWVIFFGRGKHALPVLCCAVIGILVFLPQLAQHPAFQLSLAATLAIVIAAAPLQQALEALLVRARVVPDVVATLVSAALAVSTVSQLACQPIIISMTGNVNLFAIPANLLAAPLVPFITVPGTLTAFLIPVLPWVSGLILSVIAIPAAGIGAIALWVSSWPAALVAWPEGALGGVVTILHLAGAMCGLYVLMRWQRRTPPAVTSYPRPTLTTRLAVAICPSRLVRQKGLVICVVVVLVALMAQIAVLVPAPQQRVGENWVMLGCDVGQGDMFLIRTAENSAIVIDTGPEDDLAAACLNRHNIDHVELLVVTHHHEDHYGGIDGVLQATDTIESVLYSTADETASLPLDNYSLVVHAEPGMQGGTTGDVADEEIMVDWQVIAADRNATNENNASIVMHLQISYDGTSLSVLTTGDLEEDAMARLIREDEVPEHIDVLKVGHHGARNGGTEIIHHLEPSVGLIGVGEENSYGHPADEIVEAIETYGSVLRTDEHGHYGLEVEDNALIPSTARLD